VQQIYSETVGDAQLEKAILETMPEYSKLARGRPDYRIWYYYNKVDLNADGRPEVLVYLRGREVCGTGGCNLIVFQLVDHSYKPVSEISLVNNPIIVSSKRTKGWNEIIVHVVGGGLDPGYYGVLRFDGKKYPASATDGLRLRLSRIRGKAYIADNIPNNPGILLSPD
jgi:hypothetical protein